MNTPIYHALRQYSASGTVPFHMPGHKLGKGIPKELADDLLSLDVTEIPGTDNLHYAEGIIREAQELAARAFGADRTFFLVNGSTTGIHAMIMTACRPGDKLLVARDCHKSVWAGLMLGGVEPVYLAPEIDVDFGIPSVLSPGMVERGFDACPEAVGILLTRPSYYGICSDLEAICRIAHGRGKLVLVDEAHGAHLAFSSRLPGSAMALGADICVQSAHKTLPALTQSAYLHVRENRIEVDKLKFYLSVLQTSSPSYVLMAYLDIARWLMEVDGEMQLEAVLDAVEDFEKKMNAACSRIRMLHSRHVPAGQHDGTRLVLNFRDAGISGFEADTLLRKHYKIQVEMSDAHNIVCICTAADTGMHLQSLLESVLAIEKEYGGAEQKADIHIGQYKIPRIAISPAQILHTQGEKVLLQKAAGRISLRTITPYPPGIPVICPGEIIPEETIGYLLSLLEQGGNITGLEEDLHIIVCK